ncbi:MAG: hypothetical protein U0572_05885 [Phycisphaerales bacterium]
MHFPTVSESQDRVLQARQQFQRLLAQWTSDLLLMRARDNRLPRWTTRCTPTPIDVDEKIDMSLEIDLDRSQTWRRAA